MGGVRKGLLKLRCRGSALGFFFWFFFWSSWQELFEDLDVAKHGY